MNIYSSTETNFNNNGYGFLNDCLTAKITEVLNGECSLYLEFPLNAKMSDYLVEQNIIKAKTSDGDYQLFRIYRVDKDFDNIYVYANHISYDLILNMLIDVYPQNKICNDFGQWLLNNTQYNTSFSFYSDISASASARYVRKNPIEAILGDEDNSMINLFGGELKRDNFTLKLLANRGNNNKVKLMVGKNITAIKTYVDVSNLYTRIMPVGFDGLLLPEKFIDSPLINNYPSPRIAKIEFEDIKYDPESEEEGVYTNIEDAYQALRDAVQVLLNDGIDKPVISIKVNWLELSKTEQYKNRYAAFEKVGLADTITASILGIDYTTKVVKTIYNVLTDTIESFEIGTLQRNIVNAINFTQKEVDNINPASILDDAKNNATNLINNALTGYIYLDYETGNLYIMDNSDPAHAQKVWRWNLNGLGYSSTGINGTYGIAMTMDGGIVADFITTGHINTNLIEGYQELVEKVSNVYVLTAENTGTSSVDLDNARKAGIIDLIIRGNVESLYPANDLYPSDDLYPVGCSLRIVNTNGTNIVNLPIDHLDTLNDVSDEYQIYSKYDEDNDTIQLFNRLVQRIGEVGGQKVVLDNPIITEYGEISVDIYPGDSTISMIQNPNAEFYVKYYVSNAFTEGYATKAFVNSSISISEQAINIEVGRKVGKNEVIASINLSPEEVKINADKISLEGKIINLTSENIAISSTNFNVDSEGNVVANNGTFNGSINSTDGTIGAWTIDEDGLVNENGIYVKNVPITYNNVTKKYGITNMYTMSDIIVLQAILLGTLPTPEANTAQFKHFDVLNNGVLDAADLLAITKIVTGGE